MMMIPKMYQNGRIYTSIIRIQYPGLLNSIKLCLRNLNSLQISSRMNKDFVSVYKAHSQYPEPVSVQVNDLFPPTGHIRLKSVTSIWTQRDLERLEHTKLSRTDVLREVYDSGRFEAYNPTTLDVLNEQWSVTAPSEPGYRAVVRNVRAKSGDEKQFLEIWNDTRKIKTIDVEKSQKHGKIYSNDGEFGSVDWSCNCEFLLFVAEKKIPKLLSHLEPSDDKDHKPDEEVRVGEKFVQRESWGEQLTEKCQPVICVLSTESWEIKVLATPPDISPGQVLWDHYSNMIYFVGWTNLPWKLGRMYCQQRTSWLFSYDHDTHSAVCEKLTLDGLSIRSPVSSSGHQGDHLLAYLSNPNHGTHYQASQLCVMNRVTKESSVVIDIFANPQDSGFPGLFCLKLPNRCWSNDSKRIILSTQWRSRLEAVVVNIETLAVTKISNNPRIGSWSVLDCHDDIIVVAASTPNKPNTLYYGLLPPPGKEESIEWQRFADEDCSDENNEEVALDWEIITHQPSPSNVNIKYPAVDYESILLFPKKMVSDQPPPLIVFPHGGPHGVHQAGWNVLTASMCMSGFAVLLVNYRGSLGFCKDNIDSLLGNIGFQDVKDVQDAAEYVVSTGRVDGNNVFITGGSHGGFLTTHLIGQYPDYYLAAVARNPVVSIVANMVSDILDWCYVEAGLEFDHTNAPTPAIYEHMWNMSPIRYADKVKTPLQITLGSKDERVIPKQSYEYLRILRARGVNTRLLVYPDSNHPLKEVEVEADCFVNVMQWFEQHMRK